jgi:hypothetical protein
MDNCGLKKSKMIKKRNRWPAFNVIRRLHQKFYRWLAEKTGFLFLNVWVSYLFVGNGLTAHEEKVSPSPILFLQIFLLFKINFSV